MKPCLIVYYSRTGYTRRVAEAIAGTAAADLEELRPQRDYRGWAGYLRAGSDTLRLRTPPLQPLAHDPARYETVLLGTPVWAGRIPAPVYTFLVQHGTHCRRLAGFCTMGGRGGDAVLDRFAELTGKPLAGRLVLTDRDIDAGAHLDRVRAYLREVQVDSTATPQT